MRKIILIIVLLALPLVCFGQNATTQATPTNKKQPFQLTIESNKEVYEVGEEIIIRGYIKNNSLKKIYILSDDRYQLIIKIPTGNRFEYDPYPWKNRGFPTFNSYVSIAPSENLGFFTFKATAGKVAGIADNWTCLASQEKSLLPFNVVGKYEIELQYEDLWQKRTECIKGVLRAASITIEVVEKKIAPK